jgi:hypothetical protein
LKQSKAEIIVSATAAGAGDAVAQQIHSQDGGKGDEPQKESLRAGVLPLLHRQKACSEIPTTSAYKLVRPGRIVLLNSGWILCLAERIRVLALA